MAEKTLKTRISHKIDTLENWEASTIGLKKGELAIATTAAKAGNGLTEPVAMIKIGEDGVKTFNDLHWNFYAKASDVYSWAKTKEKPTYTANEISGLADYIGGQIQDTNTVYRIVKDVSATDKTVYKLQSKASAEPDTNFADIKDSTFEIYTADGINGLIDTKITALDLAGTYEPKGEGAKQAKTVQDALNAYKTDNDKAVAAVKATADAAAVKTDVYTALAGKADSTHTHTASDITDLNVGVTAVATGKTDGTISVTSGGTATDVPVKGLGSAAYTESTAYATAAQGAKADTALQAITTTANGGLKVTDNNQIDIDDAITFVFDCGTAIE